MLVLKFSIVAVSLDLVFVTQLELLKSFGKRQVKQFAKAKVL